MKAWLLLATAITISFGCATPRRRSGFEATTGPDAALAAQRARLVAMMRGDMVALDTLLAGDLTYTHTTGRLETKAEFLESLRSRRIRYDSIEIRDRQARVLASDVAVITGQARMWVDVMDVRQELDIRFTDVLVRRTGRWQTTTWHSTRLPPSGPTEISRPPQN